MTHTPCADKQFTFSSSLDPSVCFSSIPTPPRSPPQLLRLWRTCSVQPQHRNLNFKTYVHITCPTTVVGSTSTMELLTKGHQAISNSFLWLLVREWNHHMFTIRTPVDGAHALARGWFKTVMWWGNRSIFCITCSSPSNHVKINSITRPRFHIPISTPSALKQGAFSRLLPMCKVPTCSRAAPSYVNQQ